MISSFVADILASYLGTVIDVDRDKLRVSLWNGTCAFFFYVLSCLFFSHPLSTFTSHTLKS